MSETIKFGMLTLDGTRVYGGWLDYSLGGMRGLCRSRRGVRKRGTGYREGLLALLPPLPRRHRMRIRPQAFLGLSRFLL